MQGEAVAPTDSRQASVLRRRALRAAKWAARLTRIFPAAYPLALRELSLSLASKGSLRKALRAAEKSCRVAERQKAKYEYAQSLLVRGKLACQLGLPDGEAMVENARGQLESLEQAIAAGSLPSASNERQP